MTYCDPRTTARVRQARERIWKDEQAKQEAARKAAKVAAIRKVAGK